MPAIVQNLLVAATVPTDGNAVTTYRDNEATGLVVIVKGAGTLTAYTMLIQGRMSSSDSWYTVATITEATWDAQKSNAQLVRMWPEMRASLTSKTGTASITARLME